MDPCDAGDTTGVTGCAGAFCADGATPGPGWSQWRRRFDVQASENLSDLLARFLFSSGLLFGALLGSGAFLLHQTLLGWLGLVVAVVSLILLRRPRRSVAAI